MNSIFEEAKKRRLQKTEEEKLKDSQSYFSNNFTPIEWAGIRKDKEIVGRIVGNPYEMKENPWDVKIILYSEWLNDAKTSFVKITWPMIESGEKFLPDPNWILTRLYNAVHDGGWTEYTEDMVNGDDIIKKNDGKIIRRKGGKEINVYWNHIHSTKSCFQRLQKQNNIRATDKYPKNVFPSPRVILNWIDRHDSWCKENKHTKLLSAKKNPYTFKNDEGKEQIIYYIDKGIPFKLYQKIWENVVDPRHEWYENDIGLDIVLKLGADKEYIVRDALEDKISEESKQIIVSTPLTEEEKNYEKYNLDEIFKPTPYVRLKNNLISIFKLVDAELNKNFTEELEELAFEEAKEQSLNVDDNTLSVTNEIYTGQQISQEEKELNEDFKNSIENEDVKIESSQRKVRISSIDTESKLKSFLNWDKLDDDDKQDLKNGIDMFDEKDNIIWKQDVVLLPCDSCGKNLPNTVLNCPYCGIHFNTG